MTQTDKVKTEVRQGAKPRLAGGGCWWLTEGFGQQVLDELGVIPDVQHAVDTGVH